MSDKHKWSKDDHVVAFYLYRFGMESLGDPILLLKLLGLSISSVVMKFGNLISAKYNGNEGKLSSSALDLEVVKEFDNKPEPEFRKAVMNILLSKAKK